MAPGFHEDIAFRVLVANNMPDFHPIAIFRKGRLGGAVVVPAGWDCEAGPSGLERREGPGQRVKAPGHEL